MTTTRLFALAFCLGVLALAWVGVGFVGTSWLALVMTIVIAAVYGFGAWELRQFRAGTATLRHQLQELSAPPAALPEWVERIPPALRQSVRLRIEGERIGLPGPALTPYLVGLLVMLGMLGTFLGMVVTFKGAVFALQGSTDLQAIRSALAEPIRGLGLSFGTSVAGVAASAMLGLMSAISRRERLDVARLLDSRIGTVLQPFSLTHHRQETVRALQAQANALPDVVTALHAVIERIEARSTQLDAQLLERQAALQREVTGACTELARRVGASLQESLAASAQATGEGIRPIVEKAMAQVVQDTQRLHARLGEVAQSQVEAMTRQLGATEQQHGARMDQLAQLWREETGRVAERDKLSLQERTSLLERLGALTQSLEQTSGQQREAIDTMVASATSVLQQAHERFSTALDAQAGQAREVSAQATGSATELARLSDTFGDSVRLFHGTQDKLVDTLQRVEASLQKSTARSDEQLAYYVAQAREVIDLSIASQHGVIESLRQLQGKARPAQAVASVA